MKHALENLKIIDLTRVLGGPYATQILADHGADVIKVEAHIGDEVRGWGPPFSNGMASYFINVNRNKRSIAIDLLLSAKVTIKKISNFELKSSDLRSYYYQNILAFGDLLHKIHPLAGQGFNMTVRDIKVLTNIINEKKNWTMRGGRGGTCREHRSC